MDWSFLIRNKSALSVTTDSRRVTRGCVFVALRGEHFDGNDYVEQARRDGAEYVICGDNALAELQDLARAWRRELGLPVIGITGTNGKTTTKELLAAVLSTKFNIHYTQGNYNNALGVPLTLLQITREHEMAIVEMGASHPGDIRELVDIAEPDYGLITNVGRAHLEGFGSFEGVMRTKRELYDYLCAHNATIFRNEDNPHLADMLDKARRENINCQLSIVNYHTGTMPDGMHLVGGYNAENVSAALCVGGYFGVSHDDALAAVRAYVPSNNRSQRILTADNTLIVDAYNANPTSMAAALAEFTGDTCILGSMRELGTYTHLEHQNIVNMLAERKVPQVLLVGNEWNTTTAPYPVFADVSELRQWLLANPLKGRIVLLKGSHSVQLEKLLDVL